LIDAPIVAHVFLDLRVSEGLGPAVIGGNRAGMGRVKSQGSITVELAEAALLSNRQRDAEDARGHIGRACAGKCRNIDSDAGYPWYPDFR